MNIKKTFHILQKVSPKLAAKIAFNFISKPINKKIRPFEKSILEKGTSHTTSFKKFKIKTYKWGNGTKKAFLVHGWGGRAANFGAIIPELIKNNYQVISYDAPAHGDSSGKKTNFFEVSDLVKSFLKKDNYDLIISHSMGSTFAFTAMNSLKYKVNQMIVLTTPNKFMEFIHFAAEQFGLTKKTTQLLTNEAQAVTQEYNPSTLEVKNLITDVSIKNITLIHDKFDKVVSIEKTKLISSYFKNSKFFEIEGTGHYKMLWSKKVIDIIEQQVLSTSV